MKESGLTLAEAVNSGRPYKRPDWISCGVVADPLSLEFALATDYELEPLPEEKIEITKKQALSAADFLTTIEYGGYKTAMNNFLKELGFK